MKIRVVVSAVLVFVMASCGSASSISTVSPTNPPATTVVPAGPTSTGSPENTAAIERWKSSKVTRYRFHFAPGCGMCLRRVGFITVTNGEVSAWEPDATSAVTGANVDQAKLDELPTIDALLAEAAKAEREATGRVEIVYDPTTGVPTRAFIDWIEQAIDDESGWAITDYTVLDT
jgi:Family of unknown function (DUF6174)